MAPIRNAKAVFASIPTDYVRPGKDIIYDDKDTIDLDTVPLNGGFLVKTLVLAVDPYLRLQMRDPKIKTFVPAFNIGEPTWGYGVGVVLRSEHPAIKAGNHLNTNIGVMKHQEYAVYDDPQYFHVVKDIGIPWTNYVGVLGLAGQTAYIGWKEHANAKKGETAFVTTAAGSVGSFVVQLAKRDGMKVIASSGSDDKVAYAKECGADVSFNYKKEDANDVLEREGGIDLYFDNVNGKQLEAAIEHAHTRARFLMCGAASTYNNPNPYAPKNTAQIFQKELHIFGFLQPSLINKHVDKFYEEIEPLVKNKQLKFKEEVIRGLDKIGQALYDLGTGANSGKAAIVVAED